MVDVAPENLRPIEPLPDDPPALPDLGKRPELVWVAPTGLLVDETYQRDINRRSLALIRGIVANFAWRKFKPPICVRVDGGLHVIDGQHGAIAAATLRLPKIPVFVVAAGSAQERASAFVAHNQDRLVMASLDVYRAQLGAGEPVAVLLDKAVRNAGGRLKVVSKFSKNQPGDTAAVGCLRSLVVRRGVNTTTVILRAYVKAGRGPVITAELCAAEAIMCAPRTGAPLTGDQLAAAIASVGQDGILAAQARATQDRVAAKVTIAQAYRAALQRAARAA